MILVWLGCVQTVHFPETRFPEADSGLDTGSFVVPPTPAPGMPAHIERPTIDHGCNGAGTGFLASFRTDAWSGSAHALLVGPGLTELHPFVLEDSAVDGAWDRYALGPLLTGPMTQAGSVTELACAQEAEVSWVLWTSDRIGVPTDCVHWGPDPTGAIAALTQQAPEVVPLCADLGARP